MTNLATGVIIVLQCFHYSINLKSVYSKLYVYNAY